MPFNLAEKILKLAEFFSRREDEIPMYDFRKIRFISRLSFMAYGEAHRLKAI